MARVHLFSTSSPHQRKHSPEYHHQLTAEEPSDNITIAATPKDDYNEIASSNAALTAALLQNAQENSEMVGAVAAAFSVEPESLQTTNTIEPSSQPPTSSSEPAQLPSSPTVASPSQTLTIESTQPSTGEAQKQDVPLDQAAAATALQLLGLSQSESKDKGSLSQESATHSNQDESNSHTAVIANFANSFEEVDLNSEDMIQDYKRGTWTREEDELLLAGIKKFGYGRWKEIATTIPGRKGKQLKQRWDNTLAAKYVDQEWLKNKIRSDEENTIHKQQQQQMEDKTLKFLEATDWNDIAIKITEKAREGDHHAIETLLSQALLGTVANHAAAAAASSSSSNSHPNTSQTTHNTALHHPSSTSSNPSTSSATNLALPSTQQHSSSPTANANEPSSSATAATTTATADTTTTATPAATATTTTPATTNSTSPTNDTLDLSFARSSLDQNNNSTNNVASNTTTPALNYADAAALALYATQLSQHNANNTLPYFMTNPFQNNDASAVAAAAAAAVAAVAQQHSQQHNDPTRAQTQSPFPSATSSPVTTPNPLLSNTAGNNNHTNNSPNNAANVNTNRVGQKRRRSDPALADTQSAAMSIYASATPITTTINNQTQTVYPCLFPNCGKTFARLYNLKSHSRTHTDDRPFVCPACTAAFSRNHDLKRHSKIHGGDKPYKCEGCQKSFSRLDALKRHKSNQRNKQGCADV